MLNLHRILVTTDFSEYSKDAFDYSVQLAQTSGADLYVLHVFEASAFRSIPEFLPMIDKVQKEESQKLGDLAARVARENGIRVHPLFREGVPFHQILKTAREVPADLIVLATHGRTGLAHVLIGSVAERVVREASCPVFVVRPKSLSRAESEKG